MLGFYQAVVWGHSQVRIFSPPPCAPGTLCSNSSRACCVAQVSEDVKAGYRQWRDSGGKIDPVGHGDSGHAVHHNPGKSPSYASLTPRTLLSSLTHLLPHCISWHLVLQGQNLH
jgi:hypothetical protein